MGKRKRYREYWKERLNYDYNKEYNIYKYLCGGMRHKWQEKKVPKEKRFETYSAWKEHVIACYETRDLDKLKEFRRYLNRCRRVEKSTKGMPNALILPLYSAFATQILTKIDWTVMLDASKKFADDMIEYGWDVEIIMSILFIMWLVIVIVFGLLIFIPIVVMIINILKAAIMEGETESFYEDYIEIMDEVITQKEALSEKKIKADKE